MEIKVTTKDLIGDLENFPIEVVEKMLENQFKQVNKIDISVFQEYRDSDIQRGGFCWKNTIEGPDFWEDVINNENFDRFFECYAKSKEVYIRGCEDLKSGRNVIKELESRGGINNWLKLGNGNNTLYFIDPVTNYIESAIDKEYKNLLISNYTEISPGDYTIVELTIQEIADKLGINVELLRIKK